MSISINSIALVAESTDRRVVTITLDGKPAHFQAIRNGRGTIKGWIQVFNSSGLWMTVPGASRYIKGETE
jgi:hypothetical protein